MSTLPKSYPTFCEPLRARKAPLLPASIKALAIPRAGRNALARAGFQAVWEVAEYPPHLLTQIAGMRNEWVQAINRQLCQEAGIWLGIPFSEDARLALARSSGRLYHLAEMREAQINLLVRPAHSLCGMFRISSRMLNMVFANGATPEHLAAFLAPHALHVRTHPKVWHLAVGTYAWIAKASDGRWGFARLIDSKLRTFDLSVGMVFAPQDIQTLLST